MVRLFIISMVAIFALDLTTVSAQTRRQTKRSSRSARQKSLPNSVSTDSSRPKTEASPIDRLFSASLRLESAWKNRFRVVGSTTSDDYVLLSARADQLVQVAEGAKASITDEVVKNGITQMSKAYRDAVGLHGLVLRRNDPLAHEAAARARDVKQLRELKERRYREWDDPVVRDELSSEIDVLESLMRLYYREDSQARRFKEEVKNIDQSARRILIPYRLENEWASSPDKASENLFNEGSKIKTLVGECLKNSQSCSALQSALQVTASDAISKTEPDSPLVGTWKLDFVAGNIRSQPLFIVGRQGNTYSALVKDSPSEQSHFNAISVSGSSFSFVSSTPIRSYSARISGSIEGDRMVGTISMTDPDRGVYSIPFSGTRVGP